MSEKNVGVILLNTGSSDAPKTKETRRYLRQFLSDPRVFDVNPVLRWFLLNFVILPFRPKQSAEAYEQIWTERGSPLLAISEDFRDRLQELLPGAQVEIGMAYGNPSIRHAIEKVRTAGIDRIVLAPMFPQYASATVGSVLDAAYKTASEPMNVPSISAVPPFYDDPGYLDAWAEICRPALDSFKPDKIIMSFHGLPLRQIYKSDPTGQHCLKRGDCCERYLEGNPNCYRAHCMATSKGIIERLGLTEDDYIVAFQSRLGRDPWLEPATDESVRTLAKDGTKRLAVISPAFVADCLETLEELGIRAKEDFIEHGGEEFMLVPSLNSHPSWVRAAANIIRRGIGFHRG